MDLFGQSHIPPMAKSTPLEAKMVPSSCGRLARSPTGFGDDARCA